MCYVQRGSSWPDGGAVIDLSLMRSVFVDPNTCTAVAEGGCLLGDIDNETALHNLMVPLGHAPITGKGARICALPYTGAQMQP